MTDQAVIAAEFTNGSKTRLPSVAINRIENGRRELISWRSVENKREARKVAAMFDAKPWNF